MKEILIKNVTILTMDDENSRFFGWILLKNGKIDALGEGEPLACSEVLDGEGGVLTPGLIDIHSHLGLYEDGLGFEGADGNEDTDPVTPQMRAIDAVNPMDHAFREALEAGVTAAGVSPGSANAIGGQIALIKTAGRAHRRHDRQGAARDEIRPRRKSEVGLPRQGRDPGHAHGDRRAHPGQSCTRAADISRARRAPR